MNKLDFNQISKQASTAYEQATKKQMDQYLQKGPAFSVVNDFTNQIEGTLFDYCGIVFLEIVDARSKFYKQLKQYNLSNGVEEVDLCYKSGPYAGRQEYHLQLEGCRAAQKVLENYGAKVKLHAVVD